MEERYDFKSAEARAAQLWERGSYFTPRPGAKRRPFSLFLMPPNASGPMHIGNALMIAIQDILARYHRAKGDATLWVPGTDHGGYETQVTFEREMEERGEDKDVYTRREMYAAIESFVERNNELIKGQIKSMGASVDWSQFRYTLDKNSLDFVTRMFRKMVADDLIYRSSYMVNYCSSCATVLADIELKEVPGTAPLYFVKFPFQDGGHLTLATHEPEFLSAVTHMLIHPQDGRYAEHIGKTLLNPATGEPIAIVASKRKFTAGAPDETLFAFQPSSVKYDFEYAIRHKLPSRNLLDWDGKMLERYSGLMPQEAREKELQYLKERGAIERIQDAPDPQYLCKKGHAVQEMIVMTWFLNLDGEKFPLRKSALEAVKRERPFIEPHWREKGLLEWIGKMHDWPIARQNVWGIHIPIWYEVSEPEKLTVWYRDSAGLKQGGNLRALFDAGVTLEEISAGLERVYAAEGCQWTTDREEDKTYFPETDTFDTWFSSCAWGMIVFDESAEEGLSSFYPCNVNVLGYDLSRLFVAREIFFGVYLTGRLPFRRVYFNPLIKGPDGQKMSKSLGNAVTLDEYLERYGADVTRMALVSHLGNFQDFIFTDERLEQFRNFSERLFTMGRVADTARAYGTTRYDPAQITEEDSAFLREVRTASSDAGAAIEKYQVARAQEKITSLLPRFEAAFERLKIRDDAEQATAVFYHAFKEYLVALHPFMPFMTEELYSILYDDSHPLAGFTSNLRPSR